MPSEQINTGYYSAITEAIRTEARRILSDGTVTALIGYAAGRRKGAVQPIVITTAQDADKLLFFRRLRQQPGGLPDQGQKGCAQVRPGRDRGQEL